MKRATGMYNRIYLAKESLSRAQLLYADLWLLLCQKALLGLDTEPAVSMLGFVPGKDVFTSFTLIFQSKMQPYLFAISRELSVQLFRLQADWQLKFGCGVDTRQVSAQDSEHLNLVSKEVERHMSDHRRVKGNPTDEEKHYRARCFRIFVYELATKVEAIRLGLLNKNGLLAERSSSSSRHLLPAGSACIMCGKARIRLSAQGHLRASAVALVGRNCAECDYPSRSPLSAGRRRRSRSTGAAR